VVTLTAEYFDDIGRIRITASVLLANVSYTLQRSTAIEPTWVNVRGGGNISTMGSTVVDDYEYTPNVTNFYRLLEPVFYDSFNRVYPTGGALAVTGNSGSRADTPDAASLDITGDIDIRAVADLPNYSNGTSQTLVAKYLGTGNQRSYAIRIDALGTVTMLFSLNGSMGMSATSTATLYSAGVLDGNPVSIRVTRVSATGVVTFYVGNEISPDASVWTQLGSTVAGTSGAMFSGTALLETGSLNSGVSDRTTGEILFAQVRTGIAGAVVANPDYTAQPPGTLSFVDSTGKTWTVRGDASIVEYGPLPGTDWGVADTGQTWNVGTTNAGYSAYVNEGVGVIASTTPTGHIGEMLTDQIPGAEDAEALWSAIYPDDPDLLTEDVEWGLALRSADFDNHYESNLQFRQSANGFTVRLRIMRRVADVVTLLATAVVGEWVQNERWSVRFRVEGDALSAKAWRSESNEPAGWAVTAVDSTIVAGTGVYVRGFKASGVQYSQYFGPITVDSIPVDVAASASVTPSQADVWLKSVTYPLFNRAIECVDWDALSRTSRAGFFDIKGRHEILAITDVGSSASFNITTVTRSRAENRALVALLTFGGVLMLQPPGDTEEECEDGFSGIPGGFVVPSGSVQNHSMRGRPLWQWEIQFTRVAASDLEGIVPTTITWEQLWALIGDEGTWEDVWALWSTWQELWSTQGSVSAFGGGVIG
jgi:hypothetical protein